MKKKLLWVVDYEKVMSFVWNMENVSRACIFFTLNELIPVKSL